ncbi:MAG: CYTH domain-containing protein [Gaiellaceae bacterium]
MEVELQFLYRGEPPLVVPTRLADLELHRSRTISILDTYFDTASLDLRRNGCSLRVRQAENVVSPLLTLKGPSRKRTGAKRRYEAEVEIEALPPQIVDMNALLVELDLLEKANALAGLAETARLVPVGALRNRRSEHRYEHGLHRLDLTWDELEYPTGPSEIRLEVEASSEPTERLLDRVATELRAVFGDDLLEPEKGKTRELCERLYPELLAA